MPVPCGKLILLHKAKCHAQDPQFDGASRHERKGPCLSLLEMLGVTAVLRAGRDNAIATAMALPGLERGPSNAPGVVTQAGLKNASDQQAA